MIFLAKNNHVHVCESSAQCLNSIFVQYYQYQSTFDKFISKIKRVHFFSGSQCTWTCLNSSWLQLTVQPTSASVTSSQPIVHEIEPKQDFNDDDDDNEFSEQHLPSWLGMVSWMRLVLAIQNIPVSIHTLTHHHHHQHHYHEHHNPSRSRTS